jgi:cystathionine beta-lyase family protein involved in aluminum resistance
MSDFNTKVSMDHGGCWFRLGSLYWLALCNDGMSLPDEIGEDFDAKAWEQAFGEAMPEYVDDVESIAGELIDQRKFGLLARVDIQIPIAASKSGYSTSSWGRYTMQWVYAETLEQLVETAAERAKTFIDGKLAKLREKST